MGRSPFPTFLGVKHLSVIDIAPKRHRHRFFDSCTINSILSKVEDRFHTYIFDNPNFVQTAFSRYQFDGGAHAKTATTSSALHSNVPD